MKKKQLELLSTVVRGVPAFRNCVRRSTARVRTHVHTRTQYSSTSMHSSIATPCFRGLLQRCNPPQRALQACVRQRPLLLLQGTFCRLQKRQRRQQQRPVVVQYEVVRLCSKRCLGCSAIVVPHLACMAIKGENGFAGRTPPGNGLSIFHMK